jgi:type IV secretory pathway ATPase VirB11/archaellum biosynthesis ATPase
VRQYQLVQEASDRIVLRLASRTDPDADERKRLSDAVVPVLGPGIRFQIEVVPRIALGPGGKTRPVVPLHERRPAKPA